MPIETPSGTVDGANATFTLAATPSGDVLVYNNGVLQYVTVHYTISGAIITFESGAIPQTGDLLRVIYGASLTVSAGGTSYPTAATVISKAALQMGLVTSEISDPYAETDGNIVVLRELLTSVGQEIRDARGWSHLEKTATITTSDGDYQYDTPSDFGGKIGSTGWNRSTIWPTGSLSPQDWQAIQAQDATLVFGPHVRFTNGEVQLSPTPSSVETLAYEYRSLFWVKPSGQATPTEEEPTAASDTLYFPQRLLIAALKSAFKREKGFPSEAADQAYQAAFDAEAGKDSNNAKPLCLAPTGGELPDGNVPDAGIGS
jgi:hypothetical protein